MTHNFPTTREAVIESVCKYVPSHYLWDMPSPVIRINEDLTVDVDGDVIISNGCMQIMNCVDIKCDLVDHLPFKFGNIAGNFVLTNAPTISTLEGCPISVTGYFKIRELPLIETIKHMPTKIGGVCFISHCKRLSDLFGMPEALPGGLRLKNLPALKSLSGCCKSVKSIEITRCSLPTLEHMPSIIVDDLLMINSAVSLVGISSFCEHIGRSVYFDNCNVIGGIGLLLVKGDARILGIDRLVVDWDHVVISRQKRFADAFTIINKYATTPDGIFECQAELIAAGLEEFALL